MAVGWGLRREGWSDSDSQITIWHYATDFWYAKVARAIATKPWGWFNRVKIGPEPQRHAPQKKIARAAGRYMPIRARDGNGTAPANPTRTPI